MIGCLLKDSELSILFAENSQILLKISVTPIPEKPPNEPPPPVPHPPP
jgi:hypothetical protein